MIFSNSALYFQVPFPMMQVPGGSLTAKKLADEIINQISHVKKLHNNAKDNIVNEISLVRKSLATSPEDDASYQYKKLHDELQVLSHFSSLFGLLVIHKIKYGFPYVVISVFKFYYILLIWRVLLLMK